MLAEKFRVKLDITKLVDAIDVAKASSDAEVRREGGPHEHLLPPTSTCFLPREPASHKNLLPPREPLLPPPPRFRDVLERSTRDTLPWAATFHIPGNKVLHQTPCAKDRGRSKETF